MRYLFTALLSLIFLSANAQKINKHTLTYATKGTDTLKLDRYYSDISTKTIEPQPAIIFMFGGGFVNGTRDKEMYKPFFEYYAQQGYQVISIDYRLNLKNINVTQSKSATGMVQLLRTTIFMAVEDLYDATSYVVANANEWNIDKTKIISCGSSAGAISVLQGELMLAEGAEIAQKLPSDFKYAGVISFAGAVYSNHKKLKWNQNSTAPILLFHGDADRNVPYDKVAFFGIGMYGSEYIAKSLDKAKLPYYFCSYSNCEHEIATTPMDNARDMIDYYLENLVMNQTKLQVNEQINNLSLAKKSKRIGIKDYIRSNYGQ